MDDDDLEGAVTCLRNASDQPVHVPLDALSRRARLIQPGCDNEITVSAMVSRCNGRIRAMLYAGVLLEESGKAVS